MTMLACPTCRRFYRVKKIGVYWEEGMPGPGLDLDDPWQPYKLWVGDLLECEGCGGQVILGPRAEQPIAEHYQPTYGALSERLAPMVRIDDCRGPWDLQRARQLQAASYEARLQALDQKLVNLNAAARGLAIGEVLAREVLHALDLDVDPRTDIAQPEPPDEPPDRRPVDGMTVGKWLSRDDEPLDSRAIGDEDLKHHQSLFARCYVVLNDANPALATEFFNEYKR
jgi:hypothetical protein